MSRVTGFISRHKKPVIAIGLWLIILITARGLMAINQLTVNELVNQLVDTLKSSWLGMFLFVGFYLMRPLLLIPGTIMNLMAGMVYGVFPGIIIGVGASYLSGTLTYIVSRWIIDKRPAADGWIGSLIDFMQNNPVEAVASVLLMYISLDLTSSLAGMLHLPFRKFFLGLMVGATIPNAMGVIFGSSLEGSLENGSLQIRPEMLALSVVILIITLGISTYLRRRNPYLQEEK